MVSFRISHTFVGVPRREKFITYKYVLISGADSSSVDWEFLPESHETVAYRKLELKEGSP